MTTQIRIKYQEYPEYMFAMIAAYIPAEEGDDLRRVSGKVVFRHEDENGNTYKNGLLHSYNDKPALIEPVTNNKIWFKDGKRHRDNDRPAVETIKKQEWYKDGQLHREGDFPAVINFNFSRIPWISGRVVSQEWYINGNRHRESGPAVIDNLLGITEYWIEGQFIW